MKPSFLILFGSLACATSPVGTSLSPAPQLAPISVAGRVRDTVVFFGIDFSNVGSRVGNHYDGLLKVYQGPVEITAATVASWSQWTKEIGQTGFTRAGYPLRQVSAAFSQLQSYSGVHFAIAGKASQVRVDTYGRLAGNNTQASITITWELFDARSRSVIYTAMTSGDATTAGQSGDAIANAYRMALASFLADESLVRALQNASTPVRAPRAADNVPWRRILPRESDIIEFASKDQKIDARQSPIAGASVAVVALRGDTGFGSAFLLTKDGLALTNFHVVREQQTLTARFEGGVERPVRVVRVDSLADLALVEIFCPTDCSTAALGPEGFPAIGTEVYAIGTPVSESLDHTVTKGIVSALRRRGPITLLQTDAAVNPGNSGGPLVDAKHGSVVGVVTLKLVTEGVEGLGFAISIDDALRTLGVVRPLAR
jgi:S1-C subfamily serine protease